MLFPSSFWKSRLANCVLVTVRTATKRASGGKSANNSTAGRRLGAKKSENEYVEAGMILYRQRGTKWYPGENCGIGRDHTIFAKEPGYVRFYRDPFHAKRKFIGVALQREHRLPTPHFEPTRRRFGYTPIDNEEIAQFELNFFGRKETHKLAKSEEFKAKSEEAKAQRISEYSTVLSGLVSSDLASNKEQLDRLDSIFQYMCRGGLTFAEADEIVSKHFLEDLDLDLRVGRVEKSEYDTKVSTFKSNSTEINKAVTFSGRKLVPLGLFNDTTCDKVEPKIEALTSKYLEDPNGTPSNVVDEVFTIFASSPGLTAKNIEYLKRKYLRRPAPIAVDSANKKDIDARVKKGEGKVVPVFNKTLSKMFVPQGSKIYI